MKSQRHTVQDRRSVSRVTAHLACRFTCKEIEHGAIIQDLSLKSALLRSDLIPPHGADVSIRIETSLSNPLILEGRIVRRDGKHAERGTAGVFMVRFNHNSPALARLITKLASKNLPKTSFI